MGKPMLWSVDEARRIQLEVIANKLGLRTYPEVMNLAIDEFIAKHGTPVVLKPEPPKETEKDKSYRECIAELVGTMRRSPNLVQRDIMQLSAAEVQKKYAIHPQSLSGFRDYITRTSRR
jgi:hypothetical protein